MADWSLPSDYNAEDSVAYARAIETLVDAAEDYHMISRVEKHRAETSREEKHKEEKHRAETSREETSREEKHRAETSREDAPQVSGGAEVHADGGSITDWIRTQRGILYASVEEFESKLPPMH